MFLLQVFSMFLKDQHCTLLKLAKSTLELATMLVKSVIKPTIPEQHTICLAIQIPSPLLPKDIRKRMRTLKFKFDSSWISPELSFEEKDALFIKYKVVCQWHEAWTQYHQNKDKKCGPPHLKKRPVEKEVEHIQANIEDLSWCELNKTKKGLHLSDREIGYYHGSISQAANSCLSEQTREGQILELLDCFKKRDYPFFIKVYFKTCLRCLRTKSWSTIH